MDHVDNITQLPVTILCLHCDQKRCA
jgi:hypothetical protein